MLIDSHRMVVLPEEEREEDMSVLYGIDTVLLETTVFSKLTPMGCVPAMPYSSNISRAYTRAET